MLDTSGEMYIMADFRSIDDKLVTAKLMRFSVGVCMRKYIYRSRKAVLKVKTGTEKKIEKVVDKVKGSD